MPQFALPSGPSKSGSRSGSIELRVALVVLALLGGAGLYYWFVISSAKPPVQPLIQPSPQAVASVSSPLPARYPVPPEEIAAPSKESPAPSAKPLPPLDDSDSSIEDRLKGLFGESKLEKLVHLQDLVRRFVIAVDHATQPQAAPPDVSLFLQVPGSYLATGKGESLTTDPANEKRYEPYMTLLESANLKKLVAVYFHFYPLFQAAYRDLSPQGYFNDRLIEVIDHLLDTPEPASPPILNPNSVYYKYLDAGLEARSSGQKLLLRLGVRNEALVKTKLREARLLLAR